MCSVGRPCSVCVVCGPVVGPIDLVLIIRFRERSTAESGGLGERHIWWQRWDLLPTTAAGPTDSG